MQIKTVNTRKKKPKIIPCRYNFGVLCYPRWPYNVYAPVLAIQSVHRNNRSKSPRLIAILITNEIIILCKLHGEININV